MHVLLGLHWVCIMLLLVLCIKLQDLLSIGYFQVVTISDNESGMYLACLTLEWLLSSCLLSFATTCQWSPACGPLWREATSWIHANSGKACWSAGMFPVWHINDLLSHFSIYSDLWCLPQGYMSRWSLCLHSMILRWHCLLIGWLFYFLLP
jgi:hypothetical protein